MDSSSRERLRASDRRGPRAFRTPREDAPAALASTEADGRVSLVDLRSFRRRTLAVAGRPTGQSPYAPAFAADGTVVVPGGEGSLVVADARTGRVLRRLSGLRGRVRTPVTSRDGRVVVATDEQAVGVWDARTGRAIGPPRPIDGGAADRPAIAPDGRTLVVVDATGELVVRDVESGRRRAVLRIDESPGSAAAFSGDGRVLAAASGDGRVRLHDGHDLHPLGPPVVAGATATVDLRPDGRLLLTAGYDGQVRMWDVATQRAVGTPLPGPRARRGLRAVLTGRPLRVCRLRRRSRDPLGPAAGRAVSTGVCGRRAAPHAR